eukprot:4172993-Pleurochrysis_carterae.AAC.1
MESTRFEARREDSKSAEKTARERAKTRAKASAFARVERRVEAHAVHACRQRPAVPLRSFLTTDAARRAARVRRSSWRRRK